MKRMIAAIVTLFALAVLAFGCTTTKVVTQDSQPEGITVSGTGKATGVPDLGVITLGVDAQADSVGEARRQAAERMDAMLTALKDGGVDEKDLQTTQFSVMPVYDYPDGRQVLRGFVVSNVVTAKIRAIDDTGELIDAAIAAGGDLARIQGVVFTIDDPSELQAEARTKAMADAKSRAETLAQAAGVELGKPRSINESGGPTPIYYDAFRAGEALDQAAPGTPIETGQLQVQVQVSVVYEMK